MITPSGTGPDVSLEAADADRDLRRQLDDRLYEFNVEATGLADGRPLAFRATDAHGELVGGLSGWTWGGCGYVEVLWVAEQHRHRGLGGRLLDAAEAEATTRGCRRMVLSTHSFQAPEFYRRRGYVETGRTPDYPLGHAQLHLSRTLD